MAAPARLMMILAALCVNTLNQGSTRACVVSAPSWSNLDASISVTKADLATSSAIYTVDAEDTSGNSSITYSMVSVSPSAVFTLHSSSGDIQPAISSIATDTYTIGIRATDSCGNFADGTLTITVNNVPPEILSLPDVVDVSETAVDETLLHIVNVTDPDGDTTTCSMTSSPAGPFLVKYLIVDGQFSTGLYIQAYPGLDYSTCNAYQLSVSCYDDTASDTGILYVYVTQNNVPTITNLQNSTSILSSLPTSSTVFHVTWTDTEDDSVSFSLQCYSPSYSASSCPFSIYSDGSVLLTASLLATTDNAYELDISVSDTYSSSGTHRLTVFVTDLNKQPVLDNLPVTVYITEATAPGTALFQASVFDEDGDTDHTFTVTSFDPASAVGLFRLNSTTGQVVLESALNYLAQENNYSITIEASDAQATSSPASLYIQVADVNQAPVLYQTNYLVQVDEGSSGTTAPDPAYNVYDPDSDTLTYAWAGGNDTSSFTINTTNGLISFAVDLDLEEASVEDRYVWLVSITDLYALSVTATLTLSIQDANDNVPVFSTSDLACTVEKDAALGTVVLTLTATDADVTQVNRELVFSIHSTNKFHVDQSGRVYLRENIESLVGTIETFSVRVRNPSPNTYDSVNIYVSVIEPVENDGFFDNGGNIAWVTLLCVFGPPLLLAVGYLCYLGYQKWSNPIGTKTSVTQVAPKDTKMALRSPSLFTRWSQVKPDNRPETRASIVTTRVSMISAGSAITADHRMETRASLVTRWSAVNSPYSPPRSRELLLPRTPLTPSGIDLNNGSWEGWKGDKWQMI